MQKNDIDTVETSVSTTRGQRVVVVVGLKIPITHLVGILKYFVIYTNC